MDMQLDISSEYRRRLRELLENYEPIATLQHMALVPADRLDNDLYENIEAAIKATTLRLSSIDYAKKQYGTERPVASAHSDASQNYLSCYYLVKDYINNALAQLQNNEQDKMVPLGVFGASLVLERLVGSFFSVHILYRLGQRYEGHAVSRLILEQIAWAYSAYKHDDDLEKIKKQSATKAINELKKLESGVGHLYGFLSDKTHIDYSNHFEFLKVENNKNVIYQAQGVMDEYAIVLLRLADIFVIVWEITQSQYLDQMVSIKKTKEGYKPKKTRDFLKVAEKHFKKVKQSKAKYS